MRDEDNYWTAAPIRNETRTAGKRETSTRLRLSETIREAADAL
jgi:hypothetical protein